MMEIIHATVQCVVIWSVLHFGKGGGKRRDGTNEDALKEGCTASGMATEYQGEILSSYVECWMCLYIYAKGALACSVIEGCLQKIVYNCTPVELYHYYIFVYTQRRQIGAM
jgi:hypothetical protein